MSRINLESLGIEPSLTVNDLERSIAFYTEGFGFEVVERHERDGRLAFVRLQAGQARIGLGRDDGAKGKDRVKGVGARLWLATTQDIVALAAQARAAGITLDGDPAPLPWGPMALSFVDPDGFLFTICST